MSLKMSSWLLLVILLAACNLNTTPAPSEVTESALIPTLTPPPTQPPPASPTPQATVQTVINPDCPDTPANWSSYTVRPGDTLSRIASTSGSTVEALTRGNCLDRPDAINVGQTLYIPSPGLQVVEAGLAAATSTAQRSSAAGSSPATSPGQPLRYYLVLANDDGQNGIAYGCGDSMIVRDGQGRTSGDLAADIRTALAELLAIRSATLEGYENALYNDLLTIDEVTVDEDSVRIELSGEYRPVGTCWDARVTGQLVYTVLQFPTINNVLIRINDRNLKQLLDASGAVRSTEPYRRSDFPQ